jgi:hypothetical protein
MNWVGFYDVQKGTANVLGGIASFVLNTFSGICSCQAHDQLHLTM